MGTVSKLATWSAVVFSAVYVIATWLIFDRFVLSDAPAERWERALVLYNPIGAIGFTAVGVLLGTKVESIRTDQVKTAATDYKDEVDAARGDDAGGGDTGGGVRDRLTAARDRLDRALRL